jgi:hypothetical protein
VAPGEFLRSVWPSTGIYCLATPRNTGGWRHWKYDAIDEAAAAALSMARGTDVYFAVHTLIEKEVPHATEPGRMQTRVQRNMSEARALFFDLDVGEGEHKYADQAAALAGLIQFCKDTSLPRPTITSSGGGLHVYWTLSDPLDSNGAWRDQATHLRQLAQHYGLRIDVKRTTDTASVLRVVGTFNWKDKANPRPVRLLVPGEATATGVFVKLVADALTQGRCRTAKLAPKLMQAEGLLGSNLETALRRSGAGNGRRRLWPARKCCAWPSCGGEFSEPELGTTV